MALAYKILGYNTHHGLLESVTETPWPLLVAAADATWPHNPTAPSPPLTPFTRSDWDALWGNKYDAVTDLASPFTLELINAYPDAKVVIVQRDFESWWPSFRSEVLDRVMIQPWASINGFLGQCMGLPAVQAMRKIHMGFFGAEDRDGILLNARTKYERFYAEVRDVAPVDRRLEYRLGDGWEPLCAFLGVRVPDVPFPRENDAAAHGEEVGARSRLIWGTAAKVLVPLVAVSIFIFVRRG